MFSKFFAVVRQRPFICGLSSSIGIHVCRYQVGDMISQTREDAKFDWWRNLSFACFGFYCGAIYFGVYGPIYSIPLDVLQRKFGKASAAISMAMFDSAITSSILYFPMFYMLQERIRSPHPSMSTAWKTCNENRAKDVSALMTVFLPLNCVNYMFIPTNYRGLFAGCSGVIWVIVLSCTRGMSENYSWRINETKT